MNHSVLTIFGASGDLAKLKIFPGIYALAVLEKLPEDFSLVGFARSQKSNEQFRESFAESIRNHYGDAVNEELLSTLLTNVYYFAGFYHEKESYEGLRKYIQELTRKSFEEISWITHFSVPPSVFEDIITYLAQTRSTEEEDIRLVIEKPFGNDEESALKLYHHIGRHFHEEKVFLLDHYLGKRTVQSIIQLRKTNRVLSAMLDGAEISNIQVTAYEDFGIKERIGYFDQVGIIKDFVQSHLLQILALVTMSIPISGSAERLQKEKDTIISALHFDPEKESVVWGQYESYKQEGEAVANSNIDTFAAIRFFIDRQEWYKVPVYLRVGKQMDRTISQVVIEFKKFDFQDQKDVPNRMIFQMKPKDQVEFHFVVGGEEENTIMRLGQQIGCVDDVCLNEHGQLLWEVMQNDQRNFVSFEEILSSWKLIDLVILFLKDRKIPVEIYSDNSKGPEQVLNMPEQDGFEWYDY